MSIGMQGLDVEVSLKDVLNRLTRQEEKTRRLEATIVALSRLDSSEDPTSTSLIRTPTHRSSSQTPVDLHWPKNRTTKTAPTPTQDNVEADLLWVTKGFLADPLVGLDAQGLVRAWNPAAEVAFGYSAPEVLGHPCPILPDDKQEEHQFLFQQALAGEAIKDVVTIRRRKNGSLVEVRVSAAGTPHGVAFLLRPEIAENPIAPLPDATLGLKRVIAAVVHDLNNLFTVICGGSEGLIERLTVGDPRRTDCEMVHAASVHAARIVQQLNTVVDSSAPLMSSADLHVVARDMAPVLKGLINPGTEFILVESTERRAPVSIDPARLSQVFLNLVANANDAMPDGGILTVSTHHDADETLVLSVSDTGCGIEKSIINQIFENNYSTKAHGRGIGLSTVAEIVNMANGKIEVESTVGLGTTFRVIFPKLNS